MTTKISQCVKHVSEAALFVVALSLSFSVEPSNADESTGRPWTLLPTGVAASLRGLSVVSDKIVAQLGDEHN